MLTKIINKDFYKDKIILITGGSGTLGKIITQFFLNKTECKKICIFSRDEYKQLIMKKHFKENINFNKLRFFIGNIRDKYRISFACKNVDIVIHAAALKQIDTIEYNPFEAIKTNILGTQNVIDACISNNVKFLVGISTDKCVSPVNLYGGTKLCLEKLVILANDYNGGKLKTCVLRYGNVLGSRGSVIPLFLKQKKEDRFTVTSKDMTRFSLMISEAGYFVLNCISICLGGEIFVPKIKKYKLSQLCQIIEPNNKIEILGLRPGEKMHEEMICKAESLSAWESDNFYIIKSDLSKESKENIEIKNRFNLKNKNKIFSFNSENAELIEGDLLLEQIISLY